MVLATHIPPKTLNLLYSLRVKERDQCSSGDEKPGTAFCSFRCVFQFLALLSRSRLRRAAPVISTVVQFAGHNVGCQVQLTTLSEMRIDMFFDSIRHNKLFIVNRI